LRFSMLVTMAGISNTGSTSLLIRTTLLNKLM